MSAPDQNAMPRRRHRLMSILIACLLGLPLGAGAAVVGQHVAHACWPAPPRALAPEVFARANDIDHLNSPDGPVSDAVETWGTTWNSRPKDGRLPAIVGAYRVHTVVEGRTFHIGSRNQRYLRGVGVVQVVVEAWGQTPPDLTDPILQVADLWPAGSCAGEFAPPAVGQSKWVLVTESEHESGSLLPKFSREFDRYAVEFTRLFGEPQRPVFEKADIEDAWQELLDRPESPSEYPTTDWLSDDLFPASAADFPLPLSQGPDTRVAPFPLPTVDLQPAVDSQPADASDETTSVPLPSAGDDGLTTVAVTVGVLAVALGAVGMTVYGHGATRRTRRSAR